MKKILAVLLCVCLLIPVSFVTNVAPEASAFSIEDIILDSDNPAQTSKVITDFLSTLINTVLNIIARVVPNFDFVRDDAKAAPAVNFYGGNDVFLDTDGEGYIWRVGYANASILPEDFGMPFKYARGSYAPWGYSTGVYQDEDGKDEDMKIRTVLFDDNSGRGISAICSVDCIGLSNHDVLTIREGVSEFASKIGINSLDISAIHSHMAIDSQGVWDSPLSTIGNNMASISGTTKTRSGVDADYLKKITESCEETLEKAYADMKDGTLTYTDIELDSYMGTRNGSPECDGNIHRLAFYPSDGSAKTYIASFGAHPEVTSYGAEFDSRLSSDFVYYMEKLTKLAGDNFIFIQGNVGTNSCGRSNSNDGLDIDNHQSAMRYGYEMAYIMLGANMNKEERIALNDELGDKLGIKTYGGNEGYTPWYDDLATFTETPVEAVLNVKHKQIKLEIENGTALLLIKLGLASNDISLDKTTGKYYTTTEIGYMEFGDALKVFLSPGELYSELYVGGYGLKNSSIKSLRETYGENVILFDLMNDAAGYVCPDETYGVFGYKYNEDTNSVTEDSWCLAVSIGKNTASALMNEYAALVESCR